jgi:3-dehydroquinate synthase
VTTIFLTGCMGSGKTTVGRALAAHLGRAFLDLDEEVHTATGHSPGDLIRQRGEAAFRDLEEEVLRRVALPDGRVIALGGGTLERPQNAELVRRTGKAVYLAASAETLAQRAHRDGIESRPLLAGDPLTRMRELLARREATYRQADVTVSTEGESAAAIALRLVQIFREPAPTGGDLERIDVALGERSYPIYFSSGERYRLGALTAERASARRAALIVDGGIDARYGAEAEWWLRQSGFEVVRAVVPAGEDSKSLAELSRLYDVLLAAGLDRSSPVIALGGGVAGDLAGFAAATLLRGVPFVQVPTTLLAQVDSSVGGKTGINHPRGKNLIGAFYQPRLVFIDTSYLRTLPPRDLSAGLAEVVKYGVISDPDLFARIEREAEGLRGGEEAPLRAVIRRSCEIKAAVVAADERETGGMRATLNFGHTFGHALERITGYGALRHGEAVAMGMVIAARLSARLGLCSQAVAERLCALLPRLGLPTSHPFVPELLVDAASTDKKARAGAIHLILVEEIGRVRSVPMSPDLLATHLRGLS